MPENCMTDETYVPLSRGLKEHLKDMSSHAVKVYIFLLLDARFCGPMKGALSITIRDIATDLKMNRNVVWKALQELSGKYIEIEKGKNQYSMSIINITKYKTVSDFAVHNTGQHTDTRSAASGQQVSSVSAASVQQGDGKRCKPADDSDLQDPKNDKNVDKSDNEKNDKKGSLFDAFSDADQIETQEFDPIFHFPIIWNRYPRQEGKIKSKQHFEKSVTTNQDWKDINTALDNYMAVIKKEKFSRNWMQGKTFFNPDNWQSYIDIDPEKITEQPKRQATDIQSMLKEGLDDEEIVEVDAEVIS